MGIRYRKSVKICKGLKVNISKSGASLSVGGRGHSLNYSSKGVRGTVGVPGTGVSYSTMLISSTNNAVRNSSYSNPQGIFTIRMDNNGHITVFDGQDIQITDQALLRKIKATPQFQSQKESLEILRQQKMEELVDKSRVENEKLVNIHKLSSLVISRDEFSRIIDELRPERYHRKEFELAPPYESDIYLRLQEEAQSTIKGNPFTVGKRRKQFVEENLPIRYQKELESWNQECALFEKEQDEAEEKQNKAFDIQYQCEKDRLQSALNGQYEIICENIDDWIAGCTLPVEIDISYEWNDKAGIVSLDVDLPEIEDLPTTEIIRLGNGNIREKKKTQTALKEQYSTMVFGLALFISSHIFNISPAISRILISGYTQRRNKAGEIQDDYIYSLRFPRDLFEQGAHLCDNPSTFCMSVENRCNGTAENFV